MFLHTYPAITIAQFAILLVGRRSTIYKRATDTVQITPTSILTCIQAPSKITSRVLFSETFKMHYLIILASLAALAIAAPVEMKDTNNVNNMKQAADTEYTGYGRYGDYSNYGKYDNYPGGVEEAAETMGTNIFSPVPTLPLNLHTSSQRKHEARHDDGRKPERHDDTHKASREHGSQCDEL